MKNKLQSQSQKTAFAAVFVIILPNLFPNLFHPLSRSYTSLFSVLFLSTNFFLIINLCNRYFITSIFVFV